MFRTQAPLTQLKRDEAGIATIEYALVAALVAFLLIGAVASCGSSLAAAFGGISSALNNAQAAPAASSASFCQQQPLPSLSAPDTSCRPSAAGTGNALAFAG